MKFMGHFPPKTRKKAVCIYDIIILSSHYCVLNSPYCKKKNKKKTVYNNVNFIIIL